MLRRKCSQGTLTQSRRHIMACVNYLQKHLLSYGSINLCTWWRLSSPLLCSRQGAAGHHCLLPPAIWQQLFSCILCRSRVPLADRRGFFFSLSYKYHSDNAENFTGPLPHVPKFPLLPFLPTSPGPHHLTLAMSTLSATVQTLVLCSYSHQGSRGPLCPPYSCRRKG